MLCLLWIWGFMETLTAARRRSPEREAYFSSCALCRCREKTGRRDGTADLLDAVSATGLRNVFI